jgi:hypothetical protein
VRGNDRLAADVLGADRTIWAITSAGYFLGVVAVVGVAILSRSRALAVYNLDREQATRVIESMLTSLEFTYERRGDLWLNSAVELCELQLFDGTQHVTIWLLHPDLRKRQEMERLVRVRVETELARPNPISGYLGSLIGGLTITVLAFFLLLMYLFYLTR